MTLASCLRMVNLTGFSQLSRCCCGIAREEGLFSIPDTLHMDHAHPNRCMECTAWLSARYGNLLSWSHGCLNNRYSRRRGPPLYMKASPKRFHPPNQVEQVLVDVQRQSDSGHFNVHVRKDSQWCSTRGSGSTSGGRELWHVRQPCHHH